MIRGLMAVAVLVLGVVPTLAAQGTFSSKDPLTLTFTTNLRDLTRERDSLELAWFGTEMKWNDSAGAERTAPIELRARGHFRRQSANCAFPPIYVRAERDVRDGTPLQGNPRLKLVTPCRPTLAEYQQYIFLEYQIYQTYALLDPVHHRTRLVNVTYVDSMNRMRPVEVTAFFLETGEEMAQNNKVEFSERTGVTWDFIPPEVIQRISLFEYWIANTDWSVAGLHNIVMTRQAEFEYRPVAYDFDWAGVINTRYSRPNTQLGLTSTRQRLHRGPCRTAEQWAPTIAHFKSQRAAIEAIWSTPLPGQDPRKLADAKKFLDELWPLLDDPRRFKREIIDQCQPEGN
jgi:hypothetical protein